MKAVARHAAVPVMLFGGLWLWAGLIAPGYRSAILLGVLWFAIAGATATRLRPDLRATVTACCVIAAATFYWTSIRETTVDEPVVRGTPASQLTPQELEKAIGPDPLAPQQ